MDKKSSGIFVSSTHSSKLDTLPSSVRHIIYSICKDVPNDIKLGEMIRAWASKK